MLKIQALIFCLATLNQIAARDSGQILAVNSLENISLPLASKANTLGTPPLDNIDENKHVEAGGWPSDGVQAEDAAHETESAADIENEKNIEAQEPVAEAQELSETPEQIPNEESWVDENTLDTDGQQQLEPQSENLVESPTAEDQFSESQNQVENQDGVQPEQSYISNLNGSEDGKSLFEDTQPDGQATPEISSFKPAEGEPFSNSETSFSAGDGLLPDQPVVEKTHFSDAIHAPHTQTQAHIDSHPRNVKILNPDIKKKQDDLLNQHNQTAVKPAGPVEKLAPAKLTVGHQDEKKSSAHEQKIDTGKIKVGVKKFAEDYEKKLIKKPVVPTELPLLISSITKNIKCDKSGHLTILYQSDPKVPESELKRSFEKYMKKVGATKEIGENLKADKQTEQLVNSKWAITILQFFAGVLQSPLKDEKSVVKKIVSTNFMELTMKVLENNLGLKEHNKVSYASLPEVDLHEFNHLLKENVPQECKAEAELKKMRGNKKEICNLANLMVLALSHIFAAKNNIIVPFFYKKKDGLLATLNKLESFHNVQVKNKLNVSKLFKEDPHFKTLINFEWAINLLQEFETKYISVKRFIPKEFPKYQGLDNVNKQILILKKNVNSQHENFKKTAKPEILVEAKKKFTHMKNFKLEDILPEHH